MNKLIVGTRSSNLAITQSKIVIKRLKEINPSINFIIKKIQTKGDILLDQDLNKVLDKGFFVSEIQNELINESIDIAIHSLKDLPTETHKNLVSFTVTKRENPKDVLVLRKDSKNKQLSDLKLIGTSSIRRKKQLQFISDKILVKSIRGNVETRIKKLDNGEYDGIILAAAGLNRLGLNKRVSRSFKNSEIIPSAGQGALAIECRVNDKKTISILKKIQDKATEICVNEERKFLKTVGGGCSSPDAVLCSINDEEIEINGKVFNKKTNEYVQGKIIDSCKNHKDIGVKLAKSLLSKISKININKIILTNEGDTVGFKSLKENKLKTYHFPMIEIKPVLFKSKDLYNFDYIIFTSKNGIKNFVDKVTILDKTKLICLGKKTELKLNEYGYESIFTANRNYAKIMANELKKSNLIKGKKVLLVQGKIAKNDLFNSLNDFCKVTRLDVYNTLMKNKINYDLKKLLNSNTITVFSSPSSFDSFIQFYDPIKTNIISIGNTTTEYIISKGYKCMLTSKMQSFEGISISILKYLNKL
tara:strand:+ start:1568 stop:3160 length:1593 start_codon:yes stop_codon:yes gene_type:complete